MNSINQRAMVRQYVFETDTCARLLVFLKEEAIFLKSRLSEIVDEGAGEDLDLLEKFQDDFLANDQRLSFLSQELLAQQKLLEKGRYVNGDIIKNQKKLRETMRKVAQLFFGTRRLFDQYLSSHCSDN